MGFISPLVGSNVTSLQENILTEIAGEFRTGNTKELSKRFSSSVNLSLLKNENVYSKAQSEIILNNFFKTNPPRGAKIVHKLDNNTKYQHAVLLLNTDKGDFRVSFSIKETKKQLQIIEIRIEKST